MSKVKNTGLGRGLDSVFLDNSTEFTDGKTMLRISNLEPNENQPRKKFDMDSLSKLAESIAAHGIIQPIIVKQSENGFYTIIAGERRWRAAKMAGLSEVPAIIMDIDESKVAEIALVENLQRENLNPLEEAAAYKTLLDDYGLTQETISRGIGKSRAAVANTLRLLDLPEDVSNMVLADKLSAGHARAILGLKNADNMKKVADMVVKNDLSVRAAEELVRRTNIEEDKKHQEKSTPETHEIDYMAELERKISSNLGRKIKIFSGKKNKKIEIEFTDDNDLEGIISKLCGKNIFEE